MSRIVKEPDVRREEILTAAQRLFYSKGYDKTSVRDIIDSVGIAKGTFYHYFESKHALLEAIAEKLIGQSETLMRAVAADTSLDAIQKMLRLYLVIGRWKTGNREQMIMFLKAMYQDGNILLRHKLKRLGLMSARPAISGIIKQGIEEGVFDVEDGDLMSLAEIFMQTSQSFSEALGNIILNADQYENPAQTAKDKKIAYERAMERILGAKKGSLPLFDTTTIDQWFVEK